jgi:glutathione S-transferase
MGCPPRRRQSTSSERLHPAPTLFPDRSEELCFALGFWADRLLFQAVIPAVFSRIGPSAPPSFIEDRRKLMDGALDFDALLAGAPSAADGLRAHLDLLETQLADGRPFLLGEAFPLADASAWHRCGSS